MRFYDTIPEGNQRFFFSDFTRVRQVIIVDIDSTIENALRATND